MAPKTDKSKPDMQFDLEPPDSVTASKWTALGERATSHPDPRERERAKHAMYVLALGDGFFCMPNPNGLARVQQFLGDGWLALYDIRAGFTNPEIESVTIDAPEGATDPLAAKHWRRIRPGIALAYARKYVQQEGGQVELYRHSEQQSPPVRPKRQARTPERERMLADIARIYVDALDSGTRTPSADAADAANRAGYAYSRQQIRDLIRQARERGLLTEGPGQGRAGGQLTLEARSILDGD